MVEDFVQGCGSKDFFNFFYRIYGLISSLWMEIIWYIDFKCIVVYSNFPIRSIFKIYINIVTTLIHMYTYNVAI